MKKQILSVWGHVPLIVMQPRVPGPIRGPSWVMQSLCPAARRPRAQPPSDLPFRPPLALPDLGQGSSGHPRTLGEALLGGEGVCVCVCVCARVRVPQTLFSYTYNKVVSVLWDFGSNNYTLRSPTGKGSQSFPPQVGCVSHLMVPGLPRSSPPKTLARTFPGLFSQVSHPNSYQLEIL